MRALSHASCLNHRGPTPVALPGHICVVYRHFPLEEVHLHALIAAEAAEAASEQGKLWEMHDLISARQPRIELSHLREFAKQFELDMTRFSGALAEHIYVSRIREAREGGRHCGADTHVSPDRS